MAAAAPASSTWSPRTKSAAGSAGVGNTQSPSIRGSSGGTYTMPYAARPFSTHAGKACTVPSRKSRTAEKTAAHTTEGNGPTLSLPLRTARTRTHRSEAKRISASSPAARSRGSGGASTTVAPRQISASVHTAVRATCGRSQHTHSSSMEKWSGRNPEVHSISSSAPGTITRTIAPDSRM
ncbi:PP11 [Orf virus]|uniref:PP11 n=1 Tax=Orf virus TaxID=10258 RepID=F1AXH7_ORFV|nr:PP11 [Orf virus]